MSESVKPEPHPLFDQATTAHSGGDLEEAERLYRKVLEDLPGFHDAGINLAVIVKNDGRVEEAENILKRILDEDANSHLAWNNLGRIYQGRFDNDEAEACYRKAIELFPAYAIGLSNLGNVLFHKKQFDEAERVFRRASIVSPTYDKLPYSLGRIAAKRCQHDLAELLFKRAIALDGEERWNAIEHLALSQIAQGRVEEAEPLYEQRLSFKPDPFLLAAYQMCLAYLPNANNEIIQASLNKWVPSCFPGEILPGPDMPDVANRKIRVGYVSGDFRRHSVTHFLMAVFEKHNKERFEIRCYSNGTEHDDLSDRIRESADAWHEISDLSDQEAYEFLRAQELDILVDLSGHTALHRLAVFSMRAAPVQVSWLGFMGSTGLPTMDYVLADKVVAPPEEEKYFSEKVKRLPHSYFCLTVPDEDVRVEKANSEHEPIWFGCFNNRSKLSAPTIGLWARILQLAPATKLCLKHQFFDDPSIKRACLVEFASYGIDPERITIVGRSVTRRELFESYRRIDIALDPFPYTGATTTAEALWMGVPVVSLQGDRWGGRMSESILNAVGLTDLVAKTMDDYIQIAVTLATNPEKLELVRAGLRERVERSPLCDSDLFAGHLEALYCEMIDERRQILTGADH